VESGAPLDIYLCENILDAAEQLKGHVFVLLSEEDAAWAEDHIGFVGTTVARMVPQARPEILKENPLMVLADSYHKLPYNGKATRATPPPIEGLYPVSNFRAEVEMKLFVYNLGHAALAYLGNLKGYTYVHETMENEELKEVFSGALDETCAALMKRYPGDITQKDIDRVREDIDLRFGNPLIQDTVKRVGRDPLRKLGREDRLIGSALFCQSLGVEPRFIARVAGAALHYHQPEDGEAMKLQRKIVDSGTAAVIRELTSLDPDLHLFQWILEAYASWKNFT
jgi:mannitol-1-phosphate 5-dehydrogenase